MTWLCAKIVEILGQQCENKNKYVSNKFPPLQKSCTPGIRATVGGKGNCQSWPLPSLGSPLEVTIRIL